MEKKYSLYLDDFRDPIDSSYYRSESVYAELQWVVVRCYDEFVKTVQEIGIPETVSFDHDLADGHYAHQSKIDYNRFIEKTGFHCAEWLINHCIDNELKLPQTILIHSMNPAGSLNIKSLFDTYNKVYN